MKKMIITILCLIFSISIMYADANDNLIAGAKNGDIEAVKTALQAGANVNSKDNDGVTALMWSAQSSNIEIVKLLIKVGADVNARDNK